MKKLILTLITAMVLVTTPTAQAKLKTCKGEFLSSRAEQSETYLYFESYGGAEHWILSKSEVGFEPMNKLEYTLIYDDKDTESNVYDDEFVKALPTSGLYPRTMIVKEIKKDIVTLKDVTGHIWSFSGAEDWMIGDICSCIMWDNGTVVITDDVIIDARYCGNTINLFWRCRF